MKIHTQRQRTAYSLVENNPLCDKLNFKKVHRILSTEYKTRRVYFEWSFEGVPIFSQHVEVTSETLKIIFCHFLHEVYKAITERGNEIAEYKKQHNV